MAKSKHVLFALFLALGLSACHRVDDKAASHSLIYGAAAVISLVLLAVCCVIVRRKRGWFVLLFSSVAVVNIGYTLLSFSTSLAVALNANRIAYLGSVFLPPAMLMILLNVTIIPYRKPLPQALLFLSLIMFLIAASPGISDIYYREVSFLVVNGVGTLVKDYGPLHPLYLIYLLGYFAAMSAVIIRAAVKKTLDSAAHAAVLVIAVGVNIGVWFIEQISPIDFEMLSVSYIISELFLLGVHLVMAENQRLRNLVKQAQTVGRPSDDAAAVPLTVTPAEPAQLEMFAEGLTRLTPAEHAIYEAHIARITTSEILTTLNIKENTLKYHNKNLYCKLGVSSRKELLEIYKQFCRLHTADPNK
ncbi:MAG: hypothetical protein E7552_06840 [Ruminococcaceae bacterium]|nr:hypothetical protein [Oscillospiraceae bacterium]